MLLRLLTIASLLQLSQAQELECLLDVGLVVDRSGSIDKDRPGEGNWAKVQAFLASVVDRFDVGPDDTRIGLVSFDNNARVHVHLDEIQNKADLRANVSNLPYFLPGGNTNTAAGLNVAREELFSPEAGDRTDVSNVLILLTDGKANRDVDQLPEAVRRLKEDGVRIIGVGVTPSIDEEQLKSIVTDPENDYLTVEDFDTLDTILGRLINQTCKSAVARNPTTDDCFIDIAIAVDGSGSIEVDNEVKGNWVLVQNFLIDLVEKFDIGLEKTRVGIVRFDNNAYLHFDLDNYDNRQDMIDSIRQLNYNPAGGRTNTDAGLRLIMSSIFVPEGGDRPRIRNVLLILTDGHPTPELNGNLLNTVNELKNDDVTILSVGVTDDVDEAFMKTIVTNPETDFIDVMDFNSLSTQLDRIVDVSCVGVEPTEPPPSDCVIDLALVVDRSGSIEKDNPVKGNWAKVQQFLADLTLGFDVGLMATRVGLVTFDNTAELHFDLDDFERKQDMVNFVRQLPYFEEGGRTNTDAGLKMARDSLFVPEGGDRQGVSNVLLLFTDGKPTPELNSDLDRTVQGLKNDGVRILGIGVTEDVNEAEMRSLVSDGQTDYFSADDFNQLNLILDQILDETCPAEPSPDCTEQADVYMVLDGSGSIDANNFAMMKTFAMDLIDDLDIDSGRVRAGLLMFNDGTLPMFRLNDFSSKSDMKDMIEGMSYPRGRTNTAAAIRYVREQGFTGNNGDRLDVPNILVIFTDGNSNDPQQTMREAYLAKQQSIHIIAVGIGDWTNTVELKTVVSYPDERNYIAVDDFSDLDTNLRLALRDRICDNTNECLSDPCVNGGTCVNGIDMYICLCRSGFAGTNCERTCSRAADVAFLLDSSGSLGPENFLREIDFVRSVVNGLNIHEDSRVSALKFSTTAEVQFYLNDYDTKAGVLSALSMSYMGGTTNTAEALRKLKSDILTVANGNREDVHDIAVLITDGKSNNFEDTWREARVDRDSGIEILAVGIGENVNIPELEAIVSYTNARNIMTVNDITNLQSLTNDVIDSICYNDNACQPNPCRNGGVCENLLHGYRCECNDNFSGHNCERSCFKRYDIVFAIDASGSIRHERFPHIIEFLAEIVDQFEVDEDLDDALFGAVSFSDSAQVAFNLNSYIFQYDVITALRQIQFQGGRTNIAAALEIIESSMFDLTNGHREDADNYVILVTDGESNVQEEDTIPMAIRTRLDAKIIVLAVGDSVNMLEARGIASQPPTTNVILAESFSDVTRNTAARTALMNNIVSATCNDVDECSRDRPCQNGAACVDGTDTYFCQCTNDFSGRNCDRRCTNRMDVTFVLDFSGSLDQVFDVVIAFAREVVEGLPFSLDRTSVAVVSYSDEPTLNFDLNDYQSKQEILNALAFRRYGGRTNTQAALQMMYNDVFRSDRGDRTGVDNIAVVVTDGGSNMQRSQTAIRAREARNRGIEIYVAAAFDAPDMGEVNEIASDPDNEHVVNVPNAAAVQTAARELLDRLCA